MVVLSGKTAEEEEITVGKERYENLDGLRAYACIGIVMMHIRANGNFGISGFFYDRMIASFTNFTFLFMLLSAFSMCCGYYERFKNNSISLEQFYKRRYQRIWPFFALLCTVELLADRSLTSLYEWFADLTLAFGLLPNANISVVGVGWFLGTIFVFYMIFPFFVFLMGNKKRAWLVMGITMVLNILCQLYFFDGKHVVAGFAARTNLIYSSIFFVAGGLIYLYRDQIKNWNKWIIGVVALAVLILYFAINDSVYTLFAMYVIIAIGGIVLSDSVSRSLFQNRVVRFFAGISMEIYLCHMFVYRVIEKMHLLHITGNEILNYIVVCIVTICGAIVMSFVWKRIITLAEMKLQKA